MEFIADVAGRYNAIASASYGWHAEIKSYNKRNQVKSFNIWFSYINMRIPLFSSTIGWICHSRLHDFRARCKNSKFIIATMLFMPKVAVKFGNFSHNSDFATQLRILKRKQKGGIICIKIDKICMSKVS